MKDFTFRWFDPTTGVSAEFKASDETSFCDGAINAAIDFRLKSAATNGTACKYPPARFDVRYGDTSKPWQGMRFSHSVPPISLKGFEVQAGAPVGAHPSDAKRVRDLGHQWWMAIYKWTSSYDYHIKADPSNHRPLSTAAQG